MKKVMLLAAMLAMVLAVAVPALAQTAVVGQECVQSAVNQETGKDQTAVSQYGDATNINIQAISQQCNVTVAQVSAVVASTPGVAASTAQYNAPAAAQYQYSASSTASASASASTAPATELPSTGGSSLIALGAGVLLVAGGLLARRIVR
ncbi:MAG TPA: LPXTG cell wall anchor domain-containing protein [Rubrobacter sp.]